MARTVRWRLRRDDAKVGRVGAGTCRGRRAGRLLQVRGAARQPPPDAQQLPVDTLNAQTSFQWRYLWGLSDEPVWSPLPDPCHGQGIGRFEAQVSWYTELLTLVTLGIVSPIQLTYYCATSTPTSGPIKGPRC